MDTQQGSGMMVLPIEGSCRYNHIINIYTYIYIFECYFSHSAPAQRYVSPSKKMFCARFSILYGWDCRGIYMMKLKATLLAHCLLASSKLPCWLSDT
jgi:hypothetical protein